MSRITDKMTYVDGQYFCNICDSPHEGEELADACFDMHEPHIQVEWDRSYWGGDYSGVGRFAYLPFNGLTDENLPERFREVTGHDPVHIIHYTFDELYDEHGEPIEA